MNFAVLQKTLDIPPVEKIEQALLGLEGFTRIDAHTFANDAYGILVKNLPAEQAILFSQRLREQGIETTVVAQIDLPTLPQSKFVHQLDCAPEGLTIFDPIGRSFLLEWKYVMMIVAGCVRMTDFECLEKTVWTSNQNRGGQRRQTEYRNIEKQNQHLLLEVVVSGGVLRYSASAEKLRFGYLGERRTNSLPQNFSLLIQDLAAFAPNAVLNRGAFFLKQDGTLFSYPSKNAFFEEITWLLWKMKDGNSGSN
jgi:hypothetical protein